MSPRITTEIVSPSVFGSTMSPHEDKATSPPNVDPDKNDKLTTFWGRPISKSYIKVFEIRELLLLYLSGIIF